MTARHEWVQAELSCMLCGRSVGRLGGPVSPSRTKNWIGTTTQPFTVFRPAGHSASARRVARNERFYCPVCGGKAMVEGVERFATYEESADDHLARPRRGRPPAPWRPVPDRRLRDLGLAS